ncbi:MAG: DNA-processing protein DprA [Bacteroidales bacterium]
MIDDLALILCKGIGCKTAKLLLEHFSNSESIFSYSIGELLEAKVPSSIATILHSQKEQAYEKAKKELEFMDKNQIYPLLYTDSNYPTLLKDCIDAPFMLFVKGAFDFNIRHPLAIVGTRNASFYGKEQVDKLIEDLRYDSIYTISGLALGIDSQAHRSSIKNQIATIAILGHGLNTVYPNINIHLADEIIENGGCLITEMPSETPITPGLFPRRNRIIAGLSEGVLVAEASLKGGALITAHIAASYHRSVFAIPGKNDLYYSKGCNHLIKSQLAILTENAQDIRIELNWPIPSSKNVLHSNTNTQHLVEKEALLLNIISKEDPASLEIIYHQMDLKIPEILSTLLQLELLGLIRSLPGNRYQVQRSGVKNA